MPKLEEVAGSGEITELEELDRADKISIDNLVNAFPMAPRGEIKTIYMRARDCLRDKRIESLGAFTPLISYNLARDRLKEVYPLPEMIAEPQEQVQPPLGVISSLLRKLGYK